MSLWGSLESPPPCQGGEREFKSRLGRMANSKEYNAEYRKLNKERIAKAKQDTAARLKLEILSVYGLQCNGCGFSDVRALTIDHINNDGYVERGEKGRHFSGEKFYRFLKAQGYPKGYQTLCFNCNIIKYRETLVR